MDNVTRKRTSDDISVKPSTDKISKQEAKEKLRQAIWKVNTPHHEKPSLKFKAQVDRTSMSLDLLDLRNQINNDPRKGYKNEAINGLLKKVIENNPDPQKRLEAAKLLSIIFNNHNAHKHSRGKYGKKIKQYIKDLWANNRKDEAHILLKSIIANDKIEAKFRDSLIAYTDEDKPYKLPVSRLSISALESLTASLPDVNINILGIADDLIARDTNQTKTMALNLLIKSLTEKNISRTRFTFNVLKRLNRFPDQQSKVIGILEEIIKNESGHPKYKALRLLGQFPAHSEEAKAKLLDAINNKPQPEDHFIPNGLSSFMEQLINCSEALMEFSKIPGLESEALSLIKSFEAKYSHETPLLVYYSTSLYLYEHLAHALSSIADKEPAALEMLHSYAVNHEYDFKINKLALLKLHKISGNEEVQNLIYRIITNYPDSFKKESLEFIELLRSVLNDNKGYQNACLKIAQSDKKNAGIRLAALDRLQSESDENNLLIPNFSQRAYQILTSIAQKTSNISSVVSQLKKLKVPDAQYFDGLKNILESNTNIKNETTIDIAEELLKCDTHKDYALNIILSITQKKSDHKGLDDTRVRAADILATFPDEKETAIAAYKDIIESKGIYISLLHKLRDLGELDYAAEMYFTLGTHETVSTQLKIEAAQQFLSLKSYKTEAIRVCERIDLSKCTESELKRIRDILKEITNEASEDISLSELIPQAYVSIVKDQDLSYWEKIRALAELRGMPDYKEKAKEAYTHMLKTQYDYEVVCDAQYLGCDENLVVSCFLTLLKTPEVSIEVKMRIAEQLLKIKDHMSSGILAYYYIGFDLDPSEEIEKEIIDALQAFAIVFNTNDLYDLITLSFLAIANAPEANRVDRVTALLSIELSPEAPTEESYIPGSNRSFREAILEAAAQLFEGNLFSHTDKVQICTTYISLNDIRFRELGARILASMIEDTSNDEQATIATEILAEYDASNAREAVLSILDRQMRWVSPEGDMTKQLQVNRDAAQAIIDMEGTDTARGEEALQLMTTMEANPNSAYSLHPKLVEKAATPVNWATMVSYPQVKFGDTQVQVNTDKVFTYNNPPLSKEARNATHTDLISLIESAFKEESDHPGTTRSEFLANIYAGATDMDGNPLSTPQAILNRLNEDEYKNLFLSTRLNEPVIRKIRELIVHLQTLPTEGSNDHPSERSTQTLQLAINVLTCTTGKDINIRTLYNTLKPTVQVTEADNYSEKIDEFIAKYLQMLREDIILGQISFLNDCASEVSNRADYGGETIHHRNYISGVIGSSIGLRPEGKKPEWDPHIASVDPQLKECAKNSLLNIYLKHYRPDQIRDFLYDAINREAVKIPAGQQKGVNYNIPFYNMLVHALDDNHDEYLNIDIMSGLLPENKEHEMITRQGIEQLLIAKGYIAKASSGELP